MRLSKYFHIFSLLITFCFVFSKNATATEYPTAMNFINKLQNKNVAIGEVEAFIQDYQGFMWLGGRDALVRYDGYEFLPMQLLKDAQDKTDLEAVTQVVDLFEDSDKTLWAATRSGLIKFDRNNNYFVKLQAANGQPLEIYRSTVNRITESPSGELLLGAYQGLQVVDKTTLNVTTYAHDVNNPKSLAHNVIRDFKFDNNGNLWIATEAGLNFCNWQDKTFKNFVPDPSHPGSLPHNSGWSVEIDMDGYVWMGVNQGLYRFDPNREKFTRYRHDANNINSLSGDFIYDLLMDQEGRLWIGTDTGSVNLYQPERDKFIRFQSNGNIGSIVTNSVRRLYQDNIGDFWVGNYPTGVSYHDRSSAAFTLFKNQGDNPNSIISDNIGAILEDRDGNLWVGAGGITRIDAITGEFKRYTPGENGQIASGSILTGHIDSDGDIWVGTWASGMFRYNPKTDRFDQIPFDDTLAKTGLKTSKVMTDDVVWSIMEDHNKDMWLGMHNGGLSRFDKHTNTFYIYEQNQTHPEKSINNELVWVVYEDSKNRLWIGTPSGLNLYLRDTDTFSNYTAYTDPPNGLPAGSVMAIHEDSVRRLWLGTDGGLFQYMEDKDKFEGYTTKDGFATNSIRSITEDEMGNLWMGTSNGVVVFNPNSKEVNNYQTYNGETIGGFNAGVALTTSKGLVALGGINGLRIFDTRKLGANPHIPPVVLTDFQLFTNSVAINGPEKILTQSIGLTDQITLDYKKTMLSFTFAALNFRDPEKNQYAYMLEGFDDKWREVGNQRTALYTNLDTGKYIFRVKASNNDGLWNEKGVSLNLVQLPPPWQTWWAYSLYTLTIIAILAQFIRSQQKKRQLVEEQNRILEERVADRTKELRAKNNDIQAMLGNMRQGLFTIEPGGTIHPEYSAHLESIFNTQAIAGTKAMDLLFAHANLGQDILNQAQEVLGSVIGEDAMNFDFNSHLLPEEYQASIDSAEKVLALDWSPILVDDTVDKLMVSVRDITLLKQMEKEAKGKQKQLDIISQLLNIPAKKYLNFMTTAKQFIDQNKQCILEAKNSIESINLLFRNMHTIKGNSRTYGFSHISEAAHQAESYYNELKNNPESTWNPQTLSRDLSLVEKAINEYDTVYKEVLGRGGEKQNARRPGGFWADEKMVTHLRQYIHSIESRFPSIKEMTDLVPAGHLISEALSIPLQGTIAEIISSLPAMAQELAKEPPSVEVNDNGVRIYQASEDLMNNVFAHLLRNCLDHGIEPQEERKKLGKSDAGSILINANVSEQQLFLSVGDDGRGLNIGQLYQKGITAQRWQPSDQVSIEEVATLIFESGVTTKDQVSHISGRGVGMDAVKQFIQEAGGDIRLELSPTINHGGDTLPDFVPFKFIIRLPARHFFCKGTPLE